MSLDINEMISSARSKPDPLIKLLEVAEGTLSNRKVHESIADIIRQSVTVKAKESKPSINADEIDDAVENLLSDWWSESLPGDHDIIYILGEADFFVFQNECHEEAISFIGTACEYAFEVAEKLKDLFPHNPDASNAITEELVEEFYMDWRNRYLSRISHELGTVRGKIQK